MFIKKWLLLSGMALAIATGHAQDTSTGDTLHAAIGADGTQRIRMVGGNYFFKPKHIVVKVNTPVEISISKEAGIVPHTFVLKVPAWGVAIDTELDTDAKTIAFTPTTVGKYTFHCRNKLLFFKSHQERGMEGVIEVIP